MQDPFGTRKGRLKKHFLLYQDISMDYGINEKTKLTTMVMFLYMSIHLAAFLMMIVQNWIFINLGPAFLYVLCELFFMSFLCVTCDVWLCANEKSKKKKKKRKKDCTLIGYFMHLFGKFDSLEAHLHTLLMNKVYGENMFNQNKM